VWVECLFCKNQGEMSNYPDEAIWVWNEQWNDEKK
jgi:hypothetical protein